MVSRGLCVNADDLKKRTRSFALRVLRLAEAIPRGRAADVVARQMLRSATSVAANYRAACLARSRSEFAAKLGVVQEEADETVFWIEFAAEAMMVRQGQIAALVKEGKEILAIMVASRKTAKAAKRT